MKQLLLSLSVLALMSSCQKTVNNFYECEPVKDTVCVQPELKTIDFIYGSWWYEDERMFSIGEPKNGKVTVTFMKQINSPQTGAIDIEYTYHGEDTIYVETPNIYPDMYFYLIDSNVYGMAIEYKNIPGQGTYVPVYKL